MVADADLLTREQREVANAGARARTLVTAGPGTGKTFTLIARLESLIDNDGLAPGAEVLVLSFSRAAVGEIRRRVRGRGHVSYVRASTFDSFATRLLAESDESDEWQTLSFDPRIERATHFVADGLAEDFLADVRHVIVDEAQDLVGVRAELVMALLSRAVGFTVFGDPAQGIFDFLVSDAEHRRLGSSILYRWIRSTFPDLVEASLTNNFRARTPAARRAARFGVLLNGSAPDFEALKIELENALRESETVRLDSASEYFGEDRGTTSALLCRSNGEALRVSEMLHGCSVGHRVQQSSTDRVVVRWIAEAFAMSNGRVLSQAAVIERLQNVALPGDLEPGEAYRLLKSMEPPRRRGAGDLDLSEIAARIRRGDVPDSLCVPSAPVGVVVSTIHKAKGLEFDRVLVVEPSSRQENENAGEEARLLYVAMTRPREELLRVEPIRLGGLTSHGGPDSRWVLKGRGKDGWKRFGIEIRGDDVDSATPAQAANAVETQRYIASNVKPGDPVFLRMAGDAAEARGSVVYELVHDGYVVGATSEAFGRVLYGALKVNRKWVVHYPPKIENLHVEDIDTVAGTEAESLRCGLGHSALWLRVRVSGLGKFVRKSGS